jgi:hypothetical protein
MSDERRASDAERELAVAHLQPVELVVPAHVEVALTVAYR